PVAQVIHTADIDQLLEPELGLVTQGTRHLEQAIRRDHQRDLRLRVGIVMLDASDDLVVESCFPALRWGVYWLGHVRRAFLAKMTMALSERWCWCGGSSSAAAGCRTPEPLPSAGIRAHRHPPAPRDHSRAPPNRNSGNSRRR